jgi:hypothetical protein
MFCRMDCSECTRLEAESTRLRRVYESVNIDMGDTRITWARYRQLKGIIDQARIDLDRAEVEIMKHQKGHAQSRAACASVPV